MSQHRSAPRGRGLGPLAEAQEARAQLQEQFYRVDQLQSDIGGSVRLYADLLPERAGTTGVVPGWSSLDERANALILEYLDLLDRHDPIEETPPPNLGGAIRAFGELTPKLGYLGNEIEGYLDRFGPELRKVGEARQAVERRVARAVERTDRAEAAWREMTAEGLSFDSADRAVAQARIAARKLQEMGPKLTGETVDEACEVVERLAEEALHLATDLPRRVRSLATRVPSLTTRVEALRTRAAGVPEAMGGLRREFSLGNWKDIADRERDISTLLDQATTRIRDLRRLHEGGDTAAALAQLDRVEQTLREAESVVDGPRDRLSELRAVRADPEKLLAPVRFRLRDARYLIMRGRTVPPQPWAGRLDSAAAELHRIEDTLQVNHPDYHAARTALGLLDERIAELVADVRRG